MPEWVMGQVRDAPTMEELSCSGAWQRMHQYEKYVDEACKECKHLRYCRGGCPYNAIVPTGGKIAGVDPHCRAYTRAFNEIGTRLNDEMMNTSFLDGASSFQGAPGAQKRPGIMRLMHKVLLR